MTKTLTAHAWIREIKECDDSRHRIGCMVATRISPTKAKVSFSLCAPGDVFHPANGKALAETRQMTKTVIVSRRGIDKVEFEKALGLESIVDKHSDAGRMFDFTSTDRCLASIVKEVCDAKDTSKVDEKRLAKRTAKGRKLAGWKGQTRLSNGRFGPKA